MTQATITPTLSSATTRRIYRGRSHADLLPKIREEMGPDAIVTRERWGVAGGVGGFFAKRFLELEVEGVGAEAQRVDVRDDELPVLPPAPGAEEAGEDRQEKDDLVLDVARATLDAVSFADRLRVASEQADPAPQGTPEPATSAPDPATEATAPAVVPEPTLPPIGAETLKDVLEAAGMPRELAASIVGEAATHLAPLAGHQSLEALTRAALARRIPVRSGPPRGPIVFAGPAGSGKTACAGRLAAAYAAGSDVPVACISLGDRPGRKELKRLLAGTSATVAHAADGAEARALIAALPAGTLAIVDTPGVSAGDPGGIAALGRELTEIGGEVHLTLPVTLSASVARELRVALAALRPAYLALTRLDETRCAGGAVGLAIETQLPLSYAGRGRKRRAGLAVADAGEMAEVLLP